VAYVEIELRGTGDRAVGFVEGLRAARGDRRPVWYSRREHIGQESFVETLKERLGLTSHVILAGDLARVVAATLAGLPLLELEVVATSEVDGAELPFTYRCFSREVALGVRRLVEDALPDGVRLEGYRVEDTVDEMAHGAVLYAPVHEYTVAGEGRYLGPVEGVLTVADRIAGHDFIHPGQVRLRRRS
jgi:hypothetical protein